MFGKRLKFYLIGLSLGCLFVFFIFNQKGASCSGYLPNSRVIAETLSKKMVYTEAFSQELQTLNIREKFLKDSIITHGEIDFGRSQAQRKPCPQYLLKYPSKNPKYEVSFEKCKEEATFLSLKALR